VQNSEADRALPLIEQIQDPALRAEIQALPQYQKQTAEP
jgi:hypothetical protein